MAGFSQILLTQQYEAIIIIINHTVFEVNLILLGISGVTLVIESPIVLRQCGEGGRREGGEAEGGAKEGEGQPASGKHVQCVRMFNLDHLRNYSI